MCKKTFFFLGGCVKYFRYGVFLLICCVCFFWFYPSKKQTVQIPKIFHYVWFGSEELPDEVKETIKTWKKHQPDFKIKRWDEKNCDVNANYFIRTNYKNKKFNFASDWCRILALEEGGVYFDTDMRLKKPILPLLDTPLTLTVQREDDLSASFMAVVPNHPFIKKIKEKYNKLLRADVYSPVIWNRTFLEFFKEKKIQPQKIENKYHIYHGNILMHDFKGGENVAEHLYANSSSDIQISKWFDVFRQQYLDSYAYYILKDDVYLIPIEGVNGYFFDAKKKQVSGFVKYFSVMKYLFVFYPEMKLFLCVKSSCYEKF